MNLHSNALSLLIINQEVVANNPKKQQKMSCTERFRSMDNNMIDSVIC